MDTTEFDEERRADERSVDRVLDGSPMFEPMFGASTPAPMRPRTVKHAVEHALPMLVSPLEIVELFRVGTRWCWTCERAFQLAAKEGCAEPIAAWAVTNGVEIVALPADGTKPHRITMEQSREQELREVALAKLSLAERRALALDEDRPVR